MLDEHYHIWHMDLSEEKGVQRPRRLMDPDKLWSCLVQHDRSNAPGFRPVAILIADRLAGSKFVASKHTVHQVDMPQRQST